MTAENTAATGAPDPATPATADNPSTKDTATQPADAKAGEGNPQDEPAETDPNAKPDGEAKDDATPESYTFTMPEGMELDQALADAVTPILQKHKVSPEAAQELAGAYASRVAEMTAGGQEALDKAYVERRAADMAQQSEAWLDATKSDKEIGGANFDAVKGRVMEAVGAVATAEAKQAFNEQGWGNHPELIRMIHRLIDYTPQDRGGDSHSSAGRDKTAGQVLWPQHGT